MTKLKKKFMCNYNGESWVILDDFMALKEKLKKTQKKYARARRELNVATKLIEKIVEITCDKVEE